MNPVTPFIILLMGCLVQPVCRGQTVPGASRPTIDSTFVVVGTNQWSIRELNQMAFEHLQANGGPGKGTKVETVVNLYPTNSSLLAEISYYQGFDQPSWHVELGHDGKVKRFYKATIREGGYRSLRKTN